MTFSALPYTPHELENARHLYELPRDDNKTIVRCAAFQRGVGGDNSWGAKPHKELCQNDTIAPFTFKEPWDVNILPSGEFIFCAESREKRIKSLQSSVKCGISIIRNIALKERSTVQ